MGKKRKKTRNRGGLQVITLCISTAMVLILLGLVLLTVFTANNLSAYMKQTFTVTMLLGDDMSESEAKQLCQKLQQQPYISELTYISKTAALKEGKEALGADPSEFVGANPFPASVEFSLKSDYANSDSLKWIAKELQQNPKITEITYPEDLIDQVNKTLRKISFVLLVLAGLLLIVSFALINNTVRLGIYARRFSIHTMKLVGASWSFIRWPFIRRSIWLGLVAGIIADSVLAIGLYLFYLNEPDMMTVLNWQVLTITGVSVLLFGVLITMFCSWLSVNKFLRMKAGELYKI
ncbi:MAG: permease-like cell division protein FtsX [Prevotella sp.]|jgi:cell division transport system permease protein|nr:permease-like cell division protein FtsX [Prevotella sp.]MBR1620882.1 permease-like cell division protein FtsX [Prevotella sp.]